ncbi:MAG: PEP-CTERM sorting domain-containing protein [Gemmatimonadaceae bacterium]
MSDSQLFRRLSVAVALSWVAFANSAFAQTKPVVILFVGNSFFHGAFQPVRSYNASTVTDENANIGAGNPRSEGAQGPYGGIPAIFKKLTEEVGLNYEVHSELMSGKSLEFHYVNALPVINQSKWDVVVMHDFSTGPVPETRTGKPEIFAKYADLLEQTIHAANKSADVYLYETWSRADLTYPQKGPYFGEKIEAMANDLKMGYEGEFTHNGHFRGLAPAGDAWMRAIHTGVALANPANVEAGKVNLWGPDSYHPSIYGAYLNSCVLLYEITGKDPRKLGAAEKAASELGIASDMATTLQRIAYEQVHERHDIPGR